ncbi:hypothetical protein SLEP1_g32592 [Rubroshorea leprosula]|uniref:Uncharacterized protein n=2 Tax=Rubroshorea leprosula TaxID=152421 RepID=A0AAV5KDU1_9ROSI|nr:hypothetical protein SLEP1_g32592 [Rubroshorea leprosula]
MYLTMTKKGIHTDFTLLFVKLGNQLRLCARSTTQLKSLSSEQKSQLLWVRAIWSQVMFSSPPSACSQLHLTANVPHISANNGMDDCEMSTLQLDSECSTTHQC